MSFITKRERVFNEYELYELPSRNEGKIKAYASCTDTRAWSHFCSDKTDHLVDIIRRNNEMCRPKYVPTNVIVDTIMIGKNAEITRLKRKIEEFEKMLAVYDDLELTCDQKCEIAKAHTAIKEAYKDLDELELDLDLSGFTEGIDSEAFETGKSRGDETAKSRGDEWSYEPDPRESKGNQSEGLSCTCDASTLAVDPRIKEMTDTIITKDAKLNAMQNTIAVMENDVCEPYCIYAHIYTALEKIFVILCQNQKYKMYLELMTSGKDTRCIDIKGKILFKLKVLEKFSLALVAPCTTEFVNDGEECVCYRAEVSSTLDTFALTSSESSKPVLDNKRAHLVADIMGNDEMKELLCKDSPYTKTDETSEFPIEDYNIDAENLKRLKSLQENYDDLMTCYESLKHEKDCLHIKCRKYEDLEKEYENLKNQLREYNALWNEKEHYKNRSMDLDELKEQFLILSEETSNIEVQLKAEAEINELKTNTIEELRKENISLEKKLNESLIAFEKEKNSLLCKLKECECKEMCQDQQIKVLTVQIDRLLEQDEKVHDPQTSIGLNDAINAQKEQINNLKELLYGSEEEKQQLQEEYQNKLNHINDLRMEIEDWKSKYENLLQKNEYLENYNQDCSIEMQKLLENNNILEIDLKEKTTAIENLINVINGKSQEINNLMESMEQKNNENNHLYAKIENLQEAYKRKISCLDAEKSEVISSLEVARQESQELLEKVKSYSDLVHKQDELAYLYKKQSEENEKLKSLLNDVQEDNKKMQVKLGNTENQNSVLLQQLERLQEVTNYAANNINSLNEEKQQYKQSLELTKKESKMLEEKLQEYQDLTWQLEDLRDAHNKLLSEKERLVNELHNRTIDLDNAVQSIRISERQSEELLSKLHESESSKSELLKLNEAYKATIVDKERIQNELDKMKNEFDDLLKAFHELQLKNERKFIELENFKEKFAELKSAYNELSSEKIDLQNDLQNKNIEINHLCNTLESKIEENKNLNEQMKFLEQGHKSIVNDMDSLKKEHIATTSTLDALKKDSDKLLIKVKHYESLEADYDNLKKAYDTLMADNGNLQKELERQKMFAREAQRENRVLSSQSQNLISHSEVLENALINARTELVEKTSSIENPYAHIMKEIEEMKQEKIKNQTKIRSLLDKLDHAESIISEYDEVLKARNDKIVILENHINDLKAEIIQLHDTLESVVDTGEQISDYSNMKINNTLQSMEAHHSKATHNMKMEIAKLHRDNMLLEEKVSSTKIKQDEYDTQKRKYMSQISHLENEKEIIITDIKQLELKSVGDSALSPEKCAVEDVLNSLDRIREAFDARNNKTTSLDQTLLKVQDSFQLVQSKTDEAKRIVEKEKQKIIHEKEEAIKDRMNMERELNDLKQQLETQRNEDMKLIKDLEGEVFNQELINSKIKESSQNYINKLEEEMRSLQSMYEKSLEKIGELENNLKTVSEDSAQQLNLIEEANKSLDIKCQEIDELRQKLNELKKPKKNNNATQVSIPNSSIDEVTQTETQNINDKIDNENKHTKLEENDIKLIQLHKPRRERSADIPVVELLPSSMLNEVQILTANVDPSIDYAKNTYTNYKLQQLSTSGIEQYSYACPNDEYGRENIDHDSNDYASMDNTYLDSKPTTSKQRNLNVIEIYDKQSLNTDSSKALDNSEINNESANTNIKSQHTRTNIKQSDKINENNIKKQSKSDNFPNTPSGSTNKEFFVIYKDSDSNYEPQTKPDTRQWNRGNSEILVEAVTFQSTRPDLRYEQTQSSTKTKHSKYDEGISQLMFVEDDEDDSVKPKLNINIPRIDVDTHSLDNSETNKKSLSSFTREFYASDFKMNESKTRLSKLENERYSIHSLSNEEEQFYDSYNSTDEHKLNQNLNKRGTYLFEDRSPGTDDSKNIIPSLTKQLSYVKVNDESHHKLSRVDADVLLVRNESDKSATPPATEHRNYGLEYILDSTQQQDDPNNLKTYNAAIKLRKAKSDDRFKLLINQPITEPTSPETKKSSATFYKNESTNSQIKSSDRSLSKLYTERSVLAKLDCVEDYENQIKNLTKALENIERDYKKKIDAIKTQYDNNIKSIINEHNQGVKSIQSLHEDTLQDILKIHENEVENLRSMSIEATRKAEKLERENMTLKTKIKVNGTQSGLDEEPMKMTTTELKRHKKLRSDTKMLSKTNIEAFNVKPKSRSQGPCTCSIDTNVSDTIRNLFEQVDVEQRKKAEQTYLKYIANKMVTGNVEALDTQELSFLHLKVCRLWKLKLSKEEAIQKKIDTLETELLNKQRHTQHNIAELDRKVAEERRRLEEVREAVCRNTPTTTTNLSKYDFDREFSSPSPSSTIEREYLSRCNCNTGTVKVEVNERRSAGDLAQSSKICSQSTKQKRSRNESNRAVSANLDAEDRHDKKLYPDELPTRLRKFERQTYRSKK